MAELGGAFITVTVCAAASAAPALTFSAAASTMAIQGLCILVPRFGKLRVYRPVAVQRRRVHRIACGSEPDEGDSGVPRVQSEAANRRQLPQANMHRAFDRAAAPAVDDPRFDGTGEQRITEKAVERLHRFGCRLPVQIEGEVSSRRRRRAGFPDLAAGGFSDGDPARARSVPRGRRPIVLSVRRGSDRRSEPPARRRCRAPQCAHGRPAGRRP